VFQTKNQWAFPIDGTSRAGLEAVLCSVIEPGDKVLIPIFGRFGHLLTEIAERNGAEIHTIECKWGEVFDQEEIINEIKRVKPKVLAVVHGETSTGCMQPLDKIGPFCRELDVLCVVDAVATIGGTEVKVDEWQLDAVIGGTQKCLSVPSGMAPITYNDRVERVLSARKKVERGVAQEQDRRSVQQPIRSNYFDLSQLQDYWGPRRLNHHTEATSMLYALREGVRIVLQEGLEERFDRHRLHEKALIEGIKAMGLKLFNDVSWKLPMVTCVTIPDGVDGESVRTMLLEQFGIEIASSFGPLHGKIWRIGTMGYSCRKENILFVLAALEAVLIRHNASIQIGEGVQAALNVYELPNLAVKQE
jgi:(S)-ureidoglycine-glyoxylate aminotransferase